MYIEGDDSKRELAEIIAGLTDEEKNILRQYLESKDPRRERILKDQ